MLSPYKLKARLSTVKQGKPRIKIGIQLYKTPRNRFVMDVQKLSGEMFPFLDVCSSLMAELRL